MGELDQLDELHKYGIKLLESIETDWNHMIAEKEEADRRNRQIRLDMEAVMKKYAGDGVDEIKNG